LATQLSWQIGRTAVPAPDWPQSCPGGLATQLSRQIGSAAVQSNWPHRCPRTAVPAARIGHASVPRVAVPGLSPGGLAASCPAGMVPAPLSRQIQVGRTAVPAGWPRFCPIEMAAQLSPHRCPGGLAASADWPRLSPCGLADWMSRQIGGTAVPADLPRSCPGELAAQLLPHLCPSGLAATQTFPLLRRIGGLTASVQADWPPLSPPPLIWNLAKPDIGVFPDIGSPTDTISGYVSRYRGFLLTRYRGYRDISHVTRYRVPISGTYPISGHHVTDIVNHI
jgi:hypothetical protein